MIFKKHAAQRIEKEVNIFKDEYKYVDKHIDLIKLKNDLEVEIILIDSSSVFKNIVSILALLISIIIFSLSIFIHEIYKIDNMGYKAEVQSQLRTVKEQLTILLRDVSSEDIISNKEKELETLVNELDMYINNFLYFDNIDKRIELKVKINKTLCDIEKDIKNQAEIKGQLASLLRDFSSEHIITNKIKELKILKNKFNMYIDNFLSLNNIDKRTELKSIVNKILCIIKTYNKYNNLEQRINDIKDNKIGKKSIRKRLTVSNLVVKISIGLGLSIYVIFVFFLFAYIIARNNNIKKIILQRKINYLEQLNRNTYRSRAIKKRRKNRVKKNR